MIEALGGVSALKAGEWDRLVGEGSPFMEHAFLVALEDTRCVGSGTGWEPLILTARNAADNTLVGALPFYIKSHSHGEFVFDWGWADAAHRAGLDYYPKAVVAVPMTPVTGVRLLVAPGEDAHTIRRALVAGALQVANDIELSSIHFNFLLEEEAGALDEVGLPTRYGLQYHWFNRDAAGQHYADFDAFLARFSSKRRANIRRERRKLAEAGVQTRILQGDEITPDVMRRTFRYYVDTVRKFYWGKQYLNEDFFVALSESFADRVHLVVAEQDGEPFAGTFNLTKAGRLYGRYWGSLKEVQFTHFEVCMYRPIEWCIDNGVDVFEPGAGGEHKFERGFTPTKTFSAHWMRHPSLKRAIHEFLDQERFGVDRHIARLAGESPLKS